MLDRIRDLFIAPVFEDEEKTRVARLLNTLLPVIFLVMVLVFLIVLALTGIPTTSDDAFTLAGTLFLALISLGLFVMLRRGYVTAAGIILSAVAWDMTATVTTMGDG